MTPPSSDDALPRDPRPLRVLVVDGDPLVLRILLRRLEGQQGIFEAEGVLSSHAALARIQQDPPDVVVVDLSLSETEDFALCRTIRDDFGSVRVVAMARSAPGHDARRAFDAGCHAILHKPIDLATLRDTILETARSERPS